MKNVNTLNIDLPDMLGSGLLALLAVIITLMLTALAVESSRLEKARRGMRIRIHVNGTRGKTDVSKLIGAGLRVNGIKTWTKTTGKEALIIDHDGVGHPIDRKGPANIREQMDFLRMAGKAGAEAVVVECMALMPEAQEASTRMILPTVGVITNARLDHADAMGPIIEDVEASLASSVPFEGILIVGKGHYPEIRRIARSRGSSYSMAKDTDVPDEVAQAFSQHPHSMNVAMACSVLSACGADPSRLSEIDGVYRIPGGYDRFDMVSSETHVRVIDARGANDVASTLEALARARSEGHFKGRTALGLFCSRRDRPTRSAEFGSRFLPEVKFERVYAIGGGAEIFKEHAENVEAILIDGGPPDILIDNLREDAVLFLFGSVHTDIGFDIIDWIEEQGRLG